MRTLYREELQKIDFLDERFYSKDNINWFPSVTHILDSYPKGYGFTQWLKDVGDNSSQIAARAAESGTKVHDAIDRFFNGEMVKWVNDKGEANYSYEEWMMLMKFIEFWNTYKPKIVAHELSLCSPELGYGGTLDEVSILNGELWLIDYKSSNAIYKTYELQQAAYARMWNWYLETDLEFRKTFGQYGKIKRTGVLWLKATTRGPDKKGEKIQGNGWQIKEFERHYDESFKVFGHIHNIWKEENPNPKPKNMSFPDRFHLDMFGKELS